MLYNKLGKYSKLTENQKKLIEDNLPYVMWYFRRHNVWDEDDQQDLLYALCRFIHLYDPSRGNITTFINAVFKSRRISVIEHEKTQQEALNRIWLRWGDVLIDDHDPLLLEDTVGNNDYGFDEFESTDLYKRLIEKLKNYPKVTPNDFKIFLAFLETNNMTEVSKMYGISRQRVSQIVIKIRNLIKSKGWLN